MRLHVLVAFAGALALSLSIAAVAGCNKTDPAARKLCEQAADRYVACVQEMLGPEMAARASAKRDIDSCARDERTVEGYKVCMPKDGCEPFMDCVMDIAMGRSPKSN